MHTPGPGRTKDMEKKRSYPRSKHASQQEIALYIFGKKTKKCNALILRYLQQLGFLAGHSSMQGCCSSLLAQDESKAQLFPEVSTSFWNTVPQPRRAWGQGPSCTLSQRAGSALSPAAWSLAVARAVWKVPASKPPAHRHECGSVTARGKLSCSQVFIRPPSTVTSDVFL